MYSNRESFSNRCVCVWKKRRREKNCEKMEIKALHRSELHNLNLAGVATRDRPSKRFFMKH